ncbi:hypothetical protein [Niabella hibiscisoli]|uniref:hypothetical protein n=1 Tax=Niabella hibiscisoli TaxID=1825928 RepID=UPI001F10B760|nr:hypothetical protein [Niabella hibiscisoli]MCH5721014.1 hypothetical protein [Niabella hibiscisoli]
MSEASKDFNHIEKEIFQLIDQQFEEPYADHIKNGVVSIGMPVTFLTMAWGHPQRIEKVDKKEVMRIGTTKSRTNPEALHKW